eukprot:563130-Rhodomonas_salina.1
MLGLLGTLGVGIANPSAQTGGETAPVRGVDARRGVAAYSSSIPPAVTIRQQQYRTGSSAIGGRDLAQFRELGLKTHGRAPAVALKRPSLRQYRTCRSARVGA